MKNLIPKILSLSLFLASCESLKDEYIKENWWLYGEGYHLKDMLIFDDSASNFLQLKKDTILLDNIPKAIIVKKEKGILGADNEIHIKSINSNQIGIYHDKGSKPMNRKDRMKDKIAIKNFPLDSIRIEKISFEITKAIENIQDSELLFYLDLKPFEFEGNLIKGNLEFFAFSTNQMKRDIFKGGYIFQEDEMEPASIYFQHVHNPIDLKKLKITKSEDSETFEIELYFDFEHEKTDYKSQSITLSFELKK
jgi:hypothetical protein